METLLTLRKHHLPPLDTLASIQALSVADLKSYYLLYYPDRSWSQDTWEPRSGVGSALGLDVDVIMKLMEESGEESEDA